MLQMRHPDCAETRLQDTKFLVEATHFEWHVLWSRWCGDSRECWKPIIHKWEQLGGWLIECGRLDGRPVCISLNWTRLNDVLVCNWEPTSEVVDHAMIRKWLDKHYTATTMDGRLARCNADNYHHLTGEIERINEAANAT